MATVKVLVPTVLQEFTQGKDEVEVDAGTIAELVETLESNFPGIKGRIYNAEGKPRRFINIYCGGEDIRFLDNLETKLEDGKEVSIVPAVAGG